MMIRNATRILLALILTICALGTIAEAAPKKVVRHRAKHVTTVTRSVSGSTARTAKRSKPTVRKAATRRAATKKTTTKPR